VADHLAVAFIFVVERLNFGYSFGSFCTIPVKGRLSIRNVDDRFPLRSGNRLPPAPPISFIPNEKGDQHARIHVFDM
jgi:hypothetical protein